MVCCGETPAERRGESTYWEMAALIEAGVTEEPLEAHERSTRSHFEPDADLTPLLRWFSAHVERAVADVAPTSGIRTRLGALMDSLGMSLTTRPRRSRQAGARLFLDDGTT